ncbi:SAM-dependent methyltransferase [Rugosimonospora acidiphila]|uniref:SAM-dependent methyltransferase n=1 Tax=Rugosimonospora acidiphila TaxID=556531 RepID=UPI0031ECDAA7
MAHPRGLHPRVDTSVAHPARRYDYFLGGKDNFAADRESGDRIIAAFPTVRLWATENRAFLRRAVTHLTGEAGIRQFLDIGTGIPTSPNTHEIAQGIAPDARVVYVDNDPIVLTHARALLSSTADGATAYVDADLREPELILAAPELRQTIDLSRPVALMLVAVLHFLADSDDPSGVVDRLVGALAPGSYLVVSHVSFDFLPPKTVNQLSRVAQAEALCQRSKAELGSFFEGLDLVEPGIVPLAEWRAEHEPRPRPTAADVSCYATVARVP